MLASMRKNGVLLAVAAFICTGLVAFTYALTADRIAAQQQSALQARLQQMLPADWYDNDLAASCILLTAPEYLGDREAHPVYVARHGGQVSGYVIQSVAPDGYGGTISLLTGMDPGGIVSRVEVLEHHETPGLGDKIERGKSDWLAHFDQQRLEADLDPRWAVRKDGGMFDSFTGATITPRAVINSVRRVLLLLRQQPERIAQAQPCREGV